MSDLIDRQKAILAVCERECQELKPCAGECPSIWALESLPSVEPERKTGGWIPCSERLPERYQMVLTTINGVDLFRECVDKNFSEALETVRKRTWVSVSILGYNGWYGADGSTMSVEPIAWMPLPKPYNGGKENETD